MKKKDLEVIRRIRQKYARLSGAMDRRLRRQWAAAEAMELGWGGTRAVALATGLDRHTILAGTRELARGRSPLSRKSSVRRGRAPGAGRKRLTLTDPGLPAALEALLHPVGQAEWPLRWTCQSTRKLAHELRRQGHPVSDRTVASLLRSSGFALLDIRRCNEISTLEDRQAQFEFINQRVLGCKGEGEPAIWLETNKKEPHKSDRARKPARTDLDSVQPVGWASASIDQDAARFATASIVRWWKEMGFHLFPRASKLLIVTDIGGCNRERLLLWKAALHDLSSQLGLPLEISHFPPGTTKWTKIEHRLFNFIKQDWRGRPLVSCEVMVNLLAGPLSELRRGSNGNGTDHAATDQVKLVPTKFQNEWNFVIQPPG